MNRETKSTTLTNGPATPQLYDSFVGRQPIYDRQMHVAAYELLFRRSEHNVAGQLEPFQATAQVLLNTVLEMGWDTIAGDKRAFVNFSRGFLLLDYVQELPADRVGIEVLEDAATDGELLEAVRELAGQGYIIALDAFRYQDHLLPLVELADLIKLDIQALGLPALAEQVTRLRPHNVALVAQKVESPDEFRYCHDLGFDYFQGYFLCQPDIVKGRRSPTNRLALLQLLARLNDPGAEVDDLDALISRDAALSYKLLRLVNSAFFGLARHIDSIRQAILLLGLRSLTTWVSLVLLAGIDDKPPELLTIAQMRAKMCERLAQMQGQERPDTFFLVGLFSVLDALLDRPMLEVVQSLPLADDVTQALVDHAGAMGQTLQAVLAYERCDWETLATPTPEDQELTTAYREALAWVTEVGQTLAVAS